MLKKLLSVLPVSIVCQLGNSSFANLKERGEVKIWIVGYTKNSSLLSNGNDENYEDEESTDLIPGQGKSISIMLDKSI